jgi:hypothetical protein
VLRHVHKTEQQTEGTNPSLNSWSEAERQVLARETEATQQHRYQRVVGRRQTSHHASYRATPKRFLFGATRRERLLAAWVPIFHGFNLFLMALFLKNAPSELGLLLVLVLPQMLSAGVGAMVGKKRLAALSGALINAFSVIGLAAANLISYGKPISLKGDEVWFFAFLVLMGVIAGASTAGMRQALRRRSQKRSSQ